MQKKNRVRVVSNRVVSNRKLSFESSDFLGVTSMQTTDLGGVLDLLLRGVLPLSPPLSPPLSLRRVRSQEGSAQSVSN